MTTNTRKPKVPLSTWITVEDDHVLDEIVSRLSRASRHLVAIAALRAGLQLLRGHPEDVIALVSDEPRARRVRLRTDP